MYYCIYNFISTERFVRLQDHDRAVVNCRGCGAIYQWEARGKDGLRPWLAETRIINIKGNQAAKSDRSDTCVRYFKNKYDSSDVKLRSLFIVVGRV